MALKNITKNKQNFLIVALEKKLASRIFNGILMCSSMQLQLHHYIHFLCLYYTLQLNMNKTIAHELELDSPPWLLCLNFASLSLCPALLMHFYRFCLLGRQ